MARTAMTATNPPRVESHSSQLKRRIMTFLHQRGVPSARRLNIEVNDGIVTLQGTVSSFYERQICISCCQHVAGVMRLVDNLNVQLPRFKSQPAAAGA